MADQTFTRAINERRILTLLRTQGPTTRADMARRLSLTPSSLTNLVEALSKRDLVAELASGQRRPEPGELGRPGVKVALSRTGGFFLGVEIGVGVLRFALLDLTAAVVESETRPAPHPADAGDVVDMIAGYKGALERSRRYAGKIRAVVLTVPGLVREDGYVVHLPILGWRDLNLREISERKLDVPVSVENNANAAAFGEVYTRPTLDRDCIVYLKLGLGCGGAVVVDGRLLRGAFGTGAELGHIRIAADGPPCSCGAHGCLEPRVTLQALGRAVEPDRTWTVSELTRLPAATAAGAAEGRPAAVATCREIVDSLTLGIVTLANVFNPSTVVLGGAMRPVVQWGLSSIREAVAREVVPGMHVPAVDMSTVGEYECAVGAAAIAHHEMIDISHLAIEGPY